MDSMLFELAEHAFEQDLKRLDRLIKKQIARERERYKVINAELDCGARSLSTICRRGFPRTIGPAATAMETTTVRPQVISRNAASRSAIGSST